LINDNKGKAFVNRDPLEVLLEREVSLEMDVKEFMTVSGIEYVCEAYDHSDRLDLKAEIHARRAQRRAEPDGSKYDGRVFRFLLSRYADGHTTLEQVKAEMMTTTGFAGFGAKSVDRLNQILASCGLEPFRYATRAESREQYRELQLARKESSQ